MTQPAAPSAPVPYPRLLEPLDLGFCTLPNRVLMSERISAAIAGAACSGVIFGLIMMDLSLL